MSETTEPLIAQVLHRYFPEWAAPVDTGREWVACRCPFHGDMVPSAGVSYRNNAFKCMACPAKGNALTIIKNQEEVTYAEAERVAEELSPGGYQAVSGQLPRQPRRRVFGEQGPSVPTDPARGRPVPARVRSRTTPWS